MLPHSHTNFPAEFSVFSLWPKKMITGENVATVQWKNLSTAHRNNRKRMCLETRTSLHKHTRSWRCVPHEDNDVDNRVSRTLGQTLTYESHAPPRSKQIVIRKALCLCSNIHALWVFAVLTDCLPRAKWRKFEPPTCVSSLSFGRRSPAWNVCVYALPRSPTLPAIPEVMIYWHSLGSSFPPPG